jgi:hypothetical protein
MNRAQVDVHALSLTAPMVYFADGPTGARLAQAVNDAMDQAHTASPDRFVGCATLPMQDLRGRCCIPSPSSAPLGSAASISTISWATRSTPPSQPRGVRRCPPTRRAC